MNKQRKVVITITYNEMGIIIDTKAEEVAQPDLQPTCNQLATDTISRHAAIDGLEGHYIEHININDWQSGWNAAIDWMKDVYLDELPSAQPEPIWGLPVSAERPLADVEIVPRLRTIQRQVGGSYAIDRAIEIIEAVASAQPERNTGKWNFIGDQMFECTKCGTCYTQSQFHQMRVRITDSEFPKFCPNCGCQMERSTE